jgi:excisionase family DNA binding protein
MSTIHDHPIARDVARPSADVASVWLKLADAAQYAGCGPKQLYRAVDRKQLRAAKVGGRGDLRFRREWIDAWLESLAPQLN